MGPSGLGWLLDHPDTRDPAKPDCDRDRPDSEHGDCKITPDDIVILPNNPTLDTPEITVDTKLGQSSKRTSQSTSTWACRSWVST